MTLSGLLQNIEILKSHGSLDQAIKGIAYDSREVKEGFLFAALQGLHIDGHRYIEEAIARGAVAVLHSQALSQYRREISYIQVENSRRALSPLAAALYNYPSRELTVVGVTGTDGKSSTVWFIYQLCEALKKSAGFISTVQFKAQAGEEKNTLRQSTPEAPAIHKLLRQIKDSGSTIAIVEATSHGLSSRTSRLANVDFDVAILTNVTHEHLEFHGTFAQYRSDKANLFRALSRSPQKAHIPRFGVVNMDDPNHEYFRSQSDSPVFSYSLNNRQADLYASNVASYLSGSTFTLHHQAEEQSAAVSLPGLFNLENIMAAALTVIKLFEVPLAAVCAQLTAVKGVKGRMEIVDLGQPFRVFVDYAHTPGAFMRLLPLVKEHTRGKLTAVFGSAGERDIEKRVQQGEIAARYCDRIILTDEDPRGEDPMTIIRQIASAIEQAAPGKELFLVADRKEAIKLALTRAENEDTVLLLGKGHESTIIYSTGAVHWDEHGTALLCLEELGYRG
ncbi:MAG TPA: UDP-N-acetylmuramoyl-L-alanyl-D-glutamate--2,6-diaminopimelate ligase [Spirochaetales bacterium]|nr:UDP-N-acetylmuramoyl-L-alanyl-D-glutamate--2,6-diaminopimelate ligase [Spirochaetales bacterium]